MLSAFASLKCSKKCWHNVQKPYHGYPQVNSSHGVCNDRENVFMPFIFAVQVRVVHP